MVYLLIKCTHTQVSTHAHTACMHACIHAHSRHKHTCTDRPLLDQCPTPENTYMLSPRMMYSPKGTSSTPDEVEYTRSWLSFRMTLTVWSNPFSFP